MREDLFDDVALGGLNEADDLEAVAAAGAFQGIDLPDLLDQGRPPAAGEAWARDVVVVDLDGVVLRAVGFGAAAAGLRGIEAKIAHEVFSGLGDVLGELGDETRQQRPRLAGDAPGHTRRARNGPVTARPPAPQAHPPKSNDLSVPHGPAGHPQSMKRQGLTSIREGEAGP